MGDHIGQIALDFINKHMSNEDLIKESFAANNWEYNSDLYESTLKTTFVALTMELVRSTYKSINSDEFIKAYVKKTISFADNSSTIQITETYLNICSLKKYGLDGAASLVCAHKYFDYPYSKIDGWKFHIHKDMFVDDENKTSYFKSLTNTFIGQIESSLIKKGYMKKS